MTKRTDFTVEEEAIRKIGLRGAVSETISVETAVGLEKKVLIWRQKRADVHGVEMPDLWRLTERGIEMYNRLMSTLDGQ